MKLEEIVGKREGEEREEKRRRVEIMRGNRMKRRVKGIMIMMVIMVVMGCNSGGVKGGEGALGGEGRGVGSLSEVLMEVGRSAENAFYTFLELVSDVLGFTAKSTTKKSDVGEYFSSLGAKLGEASAELEKVAVKASAGVDKDGVFDKAIRTSN